MSYHQEVVGGSYFLAHPVLLYLHCKTTPFTEHTKWHKQQPVGGRSPRYAPAPLLPPWAPKHLSPPSRRQCSSSFPRPTRSHAHRCSRLTRQHGGEQSGVVTFDLLTLKVVSESRVTWATSVPILVFLGLFFLSST